MCIRDSNTDGSQVAVGTVLSQIQSEKPVAYGSFKLNKAQRNYCATMRELLTIVRLLVEYKHYLLGHPFTIRTDHNVMV